MALVPGVLLSASVLIVPEASAELVFAGAIVTVTEVQLQIERPLHTEC